MVARIDETFPAADIGDSELSPIHLADDARLYFERDIVAIKLVRTISWTRFLTRTDHVAGLGPMYARGWNCLEEPYPRDRDGPSVVLQLSLRNGGATRAEDGSELRNAHKLLEHERVRPCLNQCRGKSVPGAVDLALFRPPRPWAHGKTGGAGEEVDRLRRSERREGGGRGSEQHKGRPIPEKGEAAPPKGERVDLTRRRRDRGRIARRASRQ